MRFQRNILRVFLSNVHDLITFSQVNVFSRLLDGSLIQLSNQFTLKQLNDGLTKFQSLYRGYITRKYTIFPSSSLSPFICNQINVLIKEGRRQSMDVTTEINEGKRYFIKWDKNNERLTLIFLFEDLVGSGFWKNFFSSKTVKISLMAKKRELEQFESVWIEVDSKMTHEIKIQEFLYKQFIKETPRDVYFLQPLEQIDKNIYTQRRFINRLDEIKFNKPFQKSQCMRDIARNLNWIHQKGVVHGDVYLKNILFEERIDDKGLLRLVSYLTDFGSAKIWGADQNRKLDDYVRWDCCKCFADINTPLMDWHGFIITNIITWFPEMASCLKWENFISTRKKVFDNESSGNFISDDFYWIGYKSFSDLTPMEKRAWNLFITICKKSSQLYLILKSSTSEILREDIEKGMIEVEASEVIRECLQFADEMCDWAKTAAVP